jgi:hypothetical protein
MSKVLQVEFDFQLDYEENRCLCQATFISDMSNLIKSDFKINYLGVVDDVMLAPEDVDDETLEYFQQQAFLYFNSHKLEILGNGHTQ